MRKASLLVIAMLGVAFAGCVDEPPTEPLPTPQEKWACYDDNDYHCLPEDYNPDPDPCPECAGYYLGTSYTLNACMATELGNDADSDGMLDNCEYELAKRFAPLLSTHPSDRDLSRESYWAAAPGYSPVAYFADQADAKIIYLLGYHMDNGNSHECPSSVDHLFCQPHLGDSEFIVVHVRYVSGRWRLSSMYTSAHWNTPTDASRLTTSASGGISFPGGNLRYPRVFVALDKHANYASRRACNDGALYSDDCGANADDARVTVEVRRNVGSQIDPLLDRVASITGSPSYPGHEYLWTRGYGFCGWKLLDTTQRSSDVCVGTSGEYGLVLREFGF